MKLTAIILAVLVCLFSGCNTRIGCPGLSYGLGASFGCLVVWGLAIGGCAALADAATMQKDQRENLVGGIALWIIGGLLLQALPHTEGGVQFIPLPPWCYSSWLPRIISAICWLFLAIGCSATCSSEKDAWEVGGSLILVALGLNALLSFASPAGVATAEIVPPPSHSVEDTIGQWERLRSERQGALDRLLSDKGELLDRIRNLGATNRTELMANPVGRTLVEELEQLCRQIAKAKSEAEMVETTVECAKSRLRTIERQALLNGGQLTDKEYTQMSAVTHVLEEALRKEQVPGTEVRLDKILDEVFREEK